MAAKMLNLDELVSEQRVVRIRGEEYPMQPISVQDFIDLTRDIEQLEKTGEQATVADQMTMMVTSIARVFPTCPKEVLFACSMDQLNAILEFTRATAEDGAPEQEAKDPGN